MSGIDGAPPPEKAKRILIITDFTDSNSNELIDSLLGNTEFTENIIFDLSKMSEDKKGNWLSFLKGRFGNKSNVRLVGIGKDIMDNMEESFKTFISGNVFESLESALKSLL